MAGPLSFTAQAQSRKVIDRTTQEILQEGLALYQSERASWLGTDWLMSTNPDRSQLGGYFSYLEGDSVRCVFYRRPEAGQPLRMLHTYSFPRQQITMESGRGQSQPRSATSHEQKLFAVREQVMQEMRDHQQLGESYQVPEGASLNVALLENSSGVSAYLLVGPREGGMVPIGGDYLLTFDANGKLQQALKLHNSYLPLTVPTDKGAVRAMMHTHLEAHPYITPTDICSLLLYQEQVPVTQHYVMGKSLVSIFDVAKQQLVVLTREAWQRMAKSQPKDTD